MTNGDTIAAIATAPGRGGVAVVRVSGPDAFAVASRVCGREFSAADAGRFFRVQFRSPSPFTPSPFTPSPRLDDGLALVFAAPRSYTGEDVVELQGHGGAVAPRRVLEACLAAGARLARRGEYTLRAFLNGRLDLSAAEAVTDLVDARTDRAADDALARLGGALSKPFERFYAAALDLSVRLEHALDFSEDELPDGFSEKLFADAAALEREMRSRLATAREGRLLREGALVVLAGAPNAGKSSLMNALLGEGRAIVSPSAGTTRDSIEEGLEIGGWPVRLVDTAGLRAADDAVEREGVARAEKLIASADVVVALDCDVPNSIRVHAKCDLDFGLQTSDFGESGDLDIGLQTLDFGESVVGLKSKVQSPKSTIQSPISVSSKTGVGLDELKCAIAARLETLSAKGEETAGADVTTRQRELLDAAVAALGRAQSAPDLAVAANECRVAAEAAGKLVGKTYSSELLDALFSRFCVGK